jgi:hypothetical protein
MFKKLSKEKKSHLILVALVTVGALTGLWFGLISAQKEKLEDISKSIDATKDQKSKMQQVVREAAQVDDALRVATRKLSEIEIGIPTSSGDLYSWVVNSLKQFNTPNYRVDMPQFGIPSVAEMRMLPGFPYSQATVPVSGSAYYWDLGKFLADFENRFPHMRVQNVNLVPGGGLTGAERERLTFQMEFITLVKSAPLN